MNRQPVDIIKIFMQAACLAFFISLTTAPASGSGSFDLDLKDLKKSAVLPASTAGGKGGAKTTGKRDSKRSATHKTETSRRKHQVKQEKIEVKAESPAIPTPTEVPEQSDGLTPSELTLQRGDNPCQLAGHIAVAVGRSVKPESLLHGLTIEPVATIGYDDLKMMVVCNMEPANAYTYERLLQRYQIILVNITGSETAAETAEKIINPLGLSYRIEHDSLTETEQTTWFLPENRQRIRPLRLVIRN